jgi:SAM-dependent methyltransferase
MTAYTTEFFDAIRSLSYQSAKRVVPVLVEMLSPTSVIDVGCGTGDWLAAFSEQGVSDFLGVDGDYIDKNQLAIPKSAFMECQLPKLPPINRKFDLAVSFEVGEHLPPPAADEFIKSVTTVAPAVVFSAAIPGQGGNDHLNEQWPTYWARLFEKHGFVAIDCLRERFWQDPDVAWYYAQNMFLYISRDDIGRYPKLREAIDPAERVRPLVHPTLHSLHATWIPPRVSVVLRALPTLLWRSAGYHVNSLLSRGNNRKVHQDGPAAPL